MKIRPKSPCGVNLPQEAEIATLAGLEAGIYSSAAAVEINAVALFRQRAAAGAVELKAIEVADVNG